MSWFGAPPGHGPQGLELYHVGVVVPDVRAAMERYSIKLGKAQAPVRVAVTGRAVGPPLFESMEVLGRDETLRRLAEALTVAGDESGSGG